MNTNSIRSRNALMKGFAVGEMIVSLLPEAPMSIYIYVGSVGAPTVSVMLGTAQQVTDAAAQHGIDTVETVDFNDTPGSVHLAARKEFDGVTVEFWNLTRANVEAVAA
ncbi:hypothetical protein [Streptomyces sp. NPDC094049]|uniref:hypothetical protein n=1 Tax=Streptomyces sp. NPDC094049 TaxID=3154987 RepID=UPI0033337A8F